MIPPKNIGTFLLVALVTVLIWVWAAGETREKKTVNATIAFIPPEPANWIVKPDQSSVSIDIEGSQLGVREIQSLVRRPIEVSIPAVLRQSTDLLGLLSQHDDFRAAGVSVLAVTPQVAEIELDQIERFAAPVRAVLPGVMTEGDVIVDPPEVQVAMPGQLRQRVGGGTGFSVEAAIERAELDRMLPGVQHAHEVKLRLPEGFGASSAVTLIPSRVKLTFTIRSRTRETKLDTVRVQLASPPEDRESYVVEIEPKQLNHVTITTDAELVRRIEANEVTVIAIVHVSSREKEARIDSKRVTCFMALVPDQFGGIRGEQVAGRVGDLTEMPTIKLRITARSP